MRYRLETLNVAQKWVTMQIFTDLIAKDCFKFSLIRKTRFFIKFNIILYNKTTFKKAMR